MADTQLLPCPFCGGTDLSIETNSVQPDDFHDAWVNCGECNADGRHAMTLEGWLPSKAEAKEEAVVAWNRRAALASRPAEVDDEGLRFLAWCRQHRKSWIQTWRRELPAAPSHTTNKEK